MAYEQHLSQSTGQTARCAVITLSDTRSEAEDFSGACIRRLLTDHGHAVIDYSLLSDEPSELQHRFLDLLDRDDVDVIISNGGTGIGRRDNAIAVVQRYLEQELKGFGELFRMLSWEQISSGAMLSRAIGGVARGKAVFALPGSTKAVELAMTKLILPELKHLLHELRK